MSISPLEALVVGATGIAFLLGIVIAIFVVARRLRPK
jgi:hypothetical protein